MREVKEKLACVDEHLTTQERSCCSVQHQERLSGLCFLFYLLKQLLCK